MPTCRARWQIGVFRVMFRSDMYDADAHRAEQASLAAALQLRSLAHTAYGTDDPHAEVTLWAIHSRPCYPRP